ncbi:MBL fold metallo-hydrolase [Sphaerotilus sp.]|uniref:MBL fold metallo-hydrolase n=1 Tax=Sphaerotilus sp. TaxID=2093942 RepID=UPI002ACE719D|nr:MBL fold metallo-hydrolase [Sphaerotilus sp.]MDZ7855655.1 MBL fold metallo-hydrolase [Sphaerotilus sp.]
MQRCFSHWITALLLSAASLTAHAVQVEFRPVGDGVYAHVGDTGARTAQNEGLNANIGLVVTSAGAVLIDSGATSSSAADIARAAGRVTSQPVRWVINTGGQDHRWLGNGWYKAQGIELIAHAQAEADMKSRGNDHLQGLKTVLGSKADGTVPTLPTRWLQGNDERLELGGVVFEFKYRGGAHTPGDMMVWLPQKEVLFTGDVVYVDRMLGVLPVSNTRQWLATFAVIEALKPPVLVPGHGRVANLAIAQADTQAYLLALRAHMKQAVDGGADVTAAVKSFDAKPFMRLLNAAELMPGNASRTYLELERE